MSLRRALPWQPPEVAGCFLTAFWRDLVMPIFEDVCHAARQRASRLHTWLCASESGTGPVLAGILGVRRAAAARKLTALVLSLAALACGPRPLAPAEFRGEIEKAIATGHPELSLEAQSDLQVQVLDAAGKEKMTLFLDNAYKEYLQSPESLQEVVTRYVASLLEASELGAVDRAQIVPVIKDTAWIAESIAAVKERGGEGPAGYVSEPYNAQLTILYAEDRPKQIRYLSPANLQELGLTAAELRPLAVENLRRLLPEIELHRSPTVTMITAGGSYEASLLLLDEVWSDEIVPVQGEPVIAIPTRDLLLLTGTQTPGGLARLREIASKSVANSSYRLTDALFVRRDGRFVEFTAGGEP